MPAAYIVTEGCADAEILKRCLPEELTRDVYVAVGEERSSAMSLAGSILVVKSRPVALVVDAGSEDEAAIEERRDFTAAFLRRTSGGVPFEVFVAVPVFEAVFFESKSAESIIGRLLGKTHPRRRIREGKMPPHEMEEVAGRCRHRLSRGDCPAAGPPYRRRFGGIAATPVDPATQRLPGKSNRGRRLLAWAASTRGADIEPR